MKFLFSKKFIILFILFMPLIPQIPSCVMANSPKKGRVIDKTTGQGMADVAVIATAEFSVSPSFSPHVGGGSGPSCTYKFVTYTDSNGDYWIPNQWLHLAFGLPWLQKRAETRWNVTALKPGYAIVEDADDYLAMTDIGVQYHGPSSVGQTPSVIWLGLFVNVAPLEMKPVESTLRKQPIYYSNLLYSGNCDDDPNDANEMRLRKDIYHAILPLVCKENPDTKLNWRETNPLRTFSANGSGLYEEIRKLAPNTIKESEAGDVPIYRAGDICQAMKTIGEPR